MKVVLAAGKRGHYYLTARALRRAGILHRFVTSAYINRAHWAARWLPERRVAVRSDPALDGAPIQTAWDLELGYRLAAAIAGRRPSLRRLYNDRFDRRVGRSLDGGTVLHVANTYAWRSMRVAQQRRMSVVVDQQSAHPDTIRACRERVYDALQLPVPQGDAARETRIRDEIESADLVLAPSPFVLEENVRHGIPRERQRFVPIGVDTRLFQPEALDATPERAGPLRVLFAGTASVLKGCVTLLQAAERCGPKTVELTWVGAMRAEMRPYVEQTRVPLRHIAPVAQQELAAQYRAADVVCLPSHVEGSALVIYEAMACGRPCIATNEAGTVIRDGVDGAIVPAGDADALAQTLQAMAADPEGRATLGRAARERVGEFDVAGYGRRLIEAYGALAEPRSTNGTFEHALEPTPKRGAAQ